MGIYSNVTIITTEAGYEHLKALADKRNKLQDVSAPLFGSQQSADTEVREAGCVAIGWPCIKWYGEFPSVNAINCAFSDLMDAGFPCEFLEIREGSLSEHIESENSQDMRLHVEASCEPNIYTD